MIYMIDVTIQYADLGEELERMLQEEWAVSDRLYAEGTMLAIWRKASGNGVVAIWDCPDHETLSEKIRAMPLYPLMTSIELTPLSLEVGGFTGKRKKA